MSISSAVNNALLFGFVGTCGCNGICAVEAPVVGAGCQGVDTTALGRVVLSVLSETEELVFHPPP